MDIIEKSEPLLIFTAIIIALLLKDVTIINNISPTLINIFLALMLFTVFLDIPLKDIRNSFKNTRFTIISLLINFIWTPLLGYILGSIFLKENVSLFIGFFMLILTPCTDWYLVFTKISKGNVALSTSLLPINLLLQLILLPVYLLLFFANTNTIQLSDLANSLIMFIIVPFILAQIVQQITKRKQELKQITVKIQNMQIIFLCIAIFGLFNTEATNLLNNINTISIVLIPIILFFIINFGVDYIIARKVKFTYKNYASLTLTTLARNSPLALAIAIKTFPHNQIILLALVIGPLIELPVLYLVSKILLHIRENKFNEVTSLD
ncbi:arsenic resistance protein [Methanosphaera sp. WGK6]|uniref:arsenic resistance protein n=1 Tax=Methanosphaera sp. WGK6 TaxID=1561964 RepID=UPI00084C71CB|nr:bile acid:sodium symporter [Methanosphaera sp. WGK6]OED30348.1 arsenic resistance protein [Methanosphaera sp. WGK6]